MGPNPVPPGNIPIPTEIGSRMGGAPTPKWDPIGFHPRPGRVFAKGFLVGEGSEKPKTTSCLWGALICDQPSCRKVFP